MGRRLAIVVLVSVLLSGCWLQPGYIGEHTRANTLENDLTIDNVDTLQQLWSAPIGVPETMGQARSHEPLVHGGRVYVAFQEHSSYFGHRHGVSAFTNTGGPLWTHYAGGTDGHLDSSPITLVGDSLYSSWAASGGGAGCYGRFERLDADDGRIASARVLFVHSVTRGNDFIAFTHQSPCGGGTRLSIRGVDEPQSRYAASVPSGPGDDVVPTTAGQSVFVVAGRRLRAFDARGCGMSSCPPMWTTTDLDLDGTVPAVATPAGTDPPRVFAVTRTSRELVAFDPTTGAVDWQAPLNASGVADLALSNGTVFVATGGTGSAAGTVQAFAAAGCGQPSCDAVWHTAPGTADGLVAPVVAGSALYVGAANDVHAYRVDGCESSPCDPVTTVSMGDDIVVSNIVVAEGRLYVTSAGQLTAFAPEP